MKVSVVMSCFNSERFIASAIESILCQTYKDFEFIIWNDGSTDRTEEIIKRFNDPRIRYYYHENTGLGQALRLACEKATGEYIARMDADDISLPERFEKEVAFLDSHPGSVLVSSAVNYMDDDGIVHNTSFPYTKMTAIRKKMLSGASVIVHPASMFRKEVYEKAGGYRALKKAQDGLLFSRMMIYGELSNIREPLLNYRVSEDSISTQTDGNAYTPIITSLRLKMVNDAEVLEDDILAYNELVRLSKECNSNNLTSVNKFRQKKAKYEVLYDMLAPIIGSSKARSIIIIAKDILASLK